jgi:hypothetical protein
VEIQGSEMLTLIGDLCCVGFINYVGVRPLVREGALHVEERK